MEYATYFRFHVDVRNLVKNRLYITKETYVQPSEYESWPYYEYEYFIEDLTEYIENENKKNEEENKKYDMASMKSDISKLTGSIPSFKNYALPKAPKL